jgi:hypothetical protein
MLRILCLHGPICVSLRDVCGTVLSHEIFDRIAGLTQVPSSALRGAL